MTKVRKLNPSTNCSGFTEEQSMFPSGSLARQTSMLTSSNTILTTTGQPIPSSSDIGVIIVVVVICGIISVAIIPAAILVCKLLFIYLFTYLQQLADVIEK